MIFDLADPLLSRRRALMLLVSAGVVTVVGCGSGDDVDDPAALASTTTASTTAADVAAEPIPEETAGPYPGDGSNGPNALTEDGVVRSDIRSSFGASTTAAEGVLTTVELTVVDAAAGAPYAGAAVYLWHCDRDGNYSMYSDGVTDENYLRGVQEAAADGTLTFTTIVPGAYAGRWPHMHFEVYPTLAEATSAGEPVVTSQLALPEETCNQGYAAAGYEQSVANLAGVSLTRDNVFSDGVDQQTPTVSGDAARGFTLRLTVPV